VPNTANQYNSAAPLPDAPSGAIPDYPCWQPPPGHADPAYRAALARLYALGQGRMLPGRDRLRAVLARAGDPHRAAPGILVGGTNGKGRCVATLSAVLSASMRTGAFLKPHLVSVRERWRVDDRTVDVPAFTAAAAEALDLIDTHRAQTGEEISFFEANVLLGALLFRGSGCAAAVWEVGLGGREDACNLVDPLVSILCNVGYDHQAILGDTLAEIATDKAYIARAGRTLLLSGPRPGWEGAYAEYAPAVRAVCMELGAALREVPAGDSAAWGSYLAHGAQGIPPDTQALVEAALEELATHGGVQSLPQGKVPIHYPGRMQAAVLGGVDLSRIAGAAHLGAVPPAPVLLDAAHNADSLRWLATVLSRRGKSPLLFGCQATRDPQEMLAQLAPYISVLVPLEVPVLRPCPLAEVAAAGQRLGLPVSLPPGLALGDVPREYAIGHVTELDPPDNTTHWLDCTAHALSLSRPGAPLVICGSIYNLGEILRVYGQPA
jgi:dihydrofolate synthase/folylpolyglutamate synthase